MDCSFFVVVYTIHKTKDIHNLVFQILLFPGHEHAQQQQQQSQSNQYVTPTANLSLLLASETGKNLVPASDPMEMSQTYTTTNNSEYNYNPLNSKDLLDDLSNLLPSDLTEDNSSVIPMEMDYNYSSDWLDTLLPSVDNNSNNYELLMDYSNCEDNNQSDPLLSSRSINNIFNNHNHDGKLMERSPSPMNIIDNSNSNWEFN